MYSSDISQADAVSAKYYKKYASNLVIRDRMNVIYLRSKGLGPGASAIAAGVSPNSVTRWAKTYQAGGITALLHLAYYRPKSDLHGFAKLIKSNFGDSPPRSIGEARKRIFKLTGLKRGITQIRQFLKNVLNFRYRKYRPLPGGKKTMAELIDLQADFIGNTLQPSTIHGLSCARRVQYASFRDWGDDPFGGGWNIGVKSWKSKKRLPNRWMIVRYLFVAKPILMRRAG